MIGLVTEEGEEKAIVRSAPDGSDNKPCFAFNQNLSKVLSDKWIYLLVLSYTQVGSHNADRPNSSDKFVLTTTDQLKVPPNTQSTVD